MNGAAELLATLQQLPQPRAYRIAFSGGLDSLVLLHLVAQLRSLLGIPVEAVHVHHGLQSSADDWLAFCEQACAELDIPLQTHRLALQPAPGDSVEAAARQARYAVIADGMQPGDMLLTAQHRDDQAETLLLQLLRGAGVDGLAAMPRLKPWARGWHARPLLDWPREHLHRYALEHDLEWVEDPSNLDDRFDRNYLRLHLMPLLKARWPAADAAIARSAAHLAAARERLQGLDREQLGDCLNAHGRLQVAPLLALDGEARAGLLRHWLRGQGVPMPPQRRLREFDRSLLHAGPQALPQVCWGGHCLRRYRDQLWLTPETLPALPNTVEAWRDDVMLQLPQGCGSLQREPAEQGLPDRLWREGRVSVRWRGEGFSCRPQARHGSRPLRKLFQDLGVPPWQRDYVPLLLVDQRLAAVGDYCLCEPLPATAGESCSRLRWTRPSWLRIDGGDVDRG